VRIITNLAHFLYRVMLEGLVVYGLVARRKGFRTSHCETKLIPLRSAMYVDNWLHNLQTSPPPSSVTCLMTGSQSFEHFLFTQTTIVLVHWSLLKSLFFIWRKYYIFAHIWLFVLASSIPNLSTGYFSPYAVICCWYCLMINFALLYRFQSALFCIIIVKCFAMVHLPRF